jgi:hypothetical protein
LTHQIRKRGAREVEVQPELTEVDGSTIIASTAWLDDEGRRQERFQVLAVRDGKIVDVQGCASRREAERFARRRT